MLAEEAVNATPEAAVRNSEAERERSTIVFPYGDLDDGVSVAKSVQAVGGSGCGWDQVAAHLNQSSTSGGFRQKMLTAKVFGLVTYAQGIVALTPLGNRICDLKQEKLAKADAFLTVPLYKTLYNTFKGIALPPASGLETEMVNLGVARKVKNKARQGFQRSAMQAGFFWSGQDRLVYPTKPIAESPADDHATEEESNSKGANGGGAGNGNGGGAQHPFIQGLIKTLPKTDSDWPMDGRRKWLQAASHIFELIYKDSDSKGSLRIEIQRDSAK
jgi:hypothetical protein